VGRLEAICVSARKGERKRPVDRARFITDRGIEGDAHAGDWHRQVSLLAAEDIAAVRRGALCGVGPGDFAENLVVSGMDLGSFGPGTRLTVGREVVLSITQIGKVCHSACAIGRQTGDCIMPRRGLFARVKVGGEARVGDEVGTLRAVPRDRFQAVVLTVSDRCSRGQAQDTAGPAVARRLEEALDAHIYRREVIPDERPVIAERLKHYCDGHSIDLVVAVGGTGFSPRDVTPEATREVLDRLAPGLDEAMRGASLRKTPHAVLSRGVSGIRGSTLVVNLPGSERSAVENLEAILGALALGLAKLRGDPGDCGRPPEPDPPRAQ
jgi:molybdenum cofactor synthesis domain-containing protein